MEVVSSIQHLAISVTETSQVGGARRAAHSIAQELRFTEEQAGKLGIVVTESATNLAKHARHGEVLLCPCEDGNGEKRVDVIAIDRGPGIQDIHKVLGDGYSTTGTSGNGMGALSRLSDHFEIYSDRNTGTVLLCRVYGHKETHRHSHESARTRLNAAFICIPKKGERWCGDTVAIRIHNRSGIFMVADGLGHGIAASEASREAAKIFTEETSLAPAALLDHIHSGLRATRGAAVSVAEIDAASHTVRYSGIGNIAAAILDGSNLRSLISHNGIVGHQAHKFQEFSYPWTESAALVMNSDGLQTNWRLTSYPGLMKKDPAIIAAVLYRDFGRGRDDVGVLVVKQAEDHA